MTKLSSTLPGGDNNGLGSLARALTTDPHKTALIVAVVDCKSITIDTDTGDKVATVRIRRVEPIDPQDTEQAQRLLVRGLERRTGAVMLPMDLEDELTALFDNLVDSVDLETGEVLDDEPADASEETPTEATVAEDEATETTETLPEAVNGPPALHLVDTGDAEDLSSFKPNPPKRGRGRPRKEPAPQAPAEPEEAPPWGM